MVERTGQGNKKSYQQLSLYLRRAPAGSLRTLTVHMSNSGTIRVI